MIPDAFTPTEEAAGRYDSANAVDDRERDHDDGTRVDHEPCDRPGCLACVVLPRAVADYWSSSIVDNDRDEQAAIRRHSTHAERIDPNGDYTPGDES